VTIGARSFAPADALRISPFEYVNPSKTTFEPRAIFALGMLVDRGTQRAGGGDYRFFAPH
jgi:hypothetical protein